MPYIKYYLVPTNFYVTFLKYVGQGNRIITTKAWIYDPPISIVSNLFIILLGQDDNNDLFSLGKL